MNNDRKICQKLLSSGEKVKIGSFYAASDAPRFRYAELIGGYLIVFPRVPLLIPYAGGSPITATPNRMMFYYIHEQEYPRNRLSL